MGITQNDAQADPHADARHRSSPRRSRWPRSPRRSPTAASTTRRSFVSKIVAPDGDVVFDAKRHVSGHARDLGRTPRRARSTCCAASITGGTGTAAAAQRPGRRRARPAPPTTRPTRTSSASRRSSRRSCGTATRPAACPAPASVGRSRRGSSSAFMDRALDGSAGDAVARRPARSCARSGAFITENGRAGDVQRRCSRARRTLADARPADRRSSTRADAPADDAADDDPRRRCELAAPRFRDDPALPVTARPSARDSVGGR